MVQFGQREGVLGGRAMFGVRCEPHVSMKLKQVFPKISPQQGLITIAVTEDSAREVAWYTGEESDSAKAKSFAAFTTGTAQVLVMSLRSGAGLDGLQRVSSVVVIGELDWSPQVMDQCIGRIDRDGQPDPVVVYYLVANDGADPGMMDVADIKRAQLVAVRDPGRALVEETSVDPDHIKKLAEKYLSGKNPAPPARVEGG